MRNYPIYPFLVCIVLTLSSCAQIPVDKTPPPTYRALNNNDLSEAKLLSIHEAFESKSLRRSQINKELSVSAKVFSLINFGAYKNLAIPIINDVQANNILNIESFVTLIDEGKNTLFYPIISIVSDEGIIVETIKPEVEFQFDNNVLTNSFKLPLGTKKFLIHTSPEYYEYTFSDSSIPNNEPSSSKYKMNDSVMMSVLTNPNITHGNFATGALAGALVGIIGSVSNSQNQVNYNSHNALQMFTLGPVGVISLKESSKQ